MISKIRGHQPSIGRVEVLDAPSFAVIGSHPVRKNSEERTRHFITSTPFDSLFPAFDEAEALKVIRTYCGYSNVARWESAPFLLQM
jgi:hypothetical protein